MKKIFLLFVVFFLTTVPLAFAQTTDQITNEPPFPPPIIRQQNFLGQNQFYTINLRGNGETVVTFKTIFANLADQPMEKIKLQIPAMTHLSDIAVFQVLEDNLPCIRWKATDPNSVTPTPTPILIPNTYNTNITQPQLYKPPYKPQPQLCEEYQQPDFTNPYSYTTSYQRAAYTLDTNNALWITLPKPIVMNESGSYFVYFRTFNYTQKTFFGAYTFTFNTPTTNDTINTLTVGINTDSDYFFRDAKGKINYQDTSIPAVTAPLGALSQSAIQSQQLNDFYSGIGQGTITKQENDLGSNESVTIQGTYADTQWKLYGKEIMTAITIMVVMLVIILIAIPLLLRKMNKQRGDPETAGTQKKSHMKVFLASLGMSFASVFFLFLYTMGMYFISMFSPLFVNNLLLMMATFAISMAVFVFFIFAPAGIIGLKKGMSWGINTFGFTILWLIIFFIATIGIVFIFSNNNQYPRPVPYMNNLNTINGGSVNSSNGVMVPQTQAIPQSR